MKNGISAIQDIRAYINKLKKNIQESDPEKLNPLIVSAVEQIADEDLKKIIIDIIQ